MEWNLNIPKIIHLYWGGGILYYLRYLTVKSFMRLNPDWEVRLYYPKYPTTHISWWTEEQKHDIKCKDFINELMSLPITKIQVDFEDYGFNNNISEVHKSDFIRLVNLSTAGGLWSDMDIIYFRPMNSLYFNTIENKNIETFYCDHNYGHSIGFLLSSQGNRFFNRLVGIAMKEFNPQLYQTMGAVIFKKYFSSAESINILTPAFNMLMDVIYAHDASFIPEILYRNNPKFTENSIGLHWYAGSSLWHKFIEETNGGLINLPNTIIGNLIKNENKWN